MGKGRWGDKVALTRRNNVFALRRRCLFPSSPLSFFFSADILRGMTKGFARLAELCKWRAEKLLTSLFIHSGAEASLTPAELCSGTTDTRATLLQRLLDLRGLHAPHPLP